jgi:outer membrane protein TolC
MDVLPVTALSRKCALAAALAGFLVPLFAWAAPLTLEEGVRLALARNERARIATERIIAASARADRARTFFFPDATLTGTYGVNPTAHPAGSIAALQMTLFDGRLFPLYRAAARDAEATVLESADERRRVAFEAAGAYLMTLSAAQVSEAAKRRQALARQAHEDAEVRFKAGLVSSNDVTRATLELATADQAATRAAGDAQTAALQLSFLLDAPVELPLTPVEGLIPDSATPDADVEALVRRATEHRPDLAASLKRVESAEATAEEPLWRWLPALTATGRYVLGNPSSSPTLPPSWSGTLALTWPLFDGGERWADRAERIALSRIAALTRDATARQVALDVRNARVALEIAEAAVRQAAVGAEVARKNAGETEVLYRQGLARAIEVADANQRLFEAEVTLTREYYAKALAWLDLRSALGEDPLGREIYP